MHWSLAAAGVLAACAAWTASALAQDPPAVSPPVVQNSTEVPYPAGAKGEAVVLLELIVEVDGSVSSATVTEGEEPFAEQARRAALSWRFLPARRDDVPIAARVRARVEFHVVPSVAPPDVAAIVSDESTAIPHTEAGTTPAVPAPLEVTVRGQRREIGQTTLSAADMREMPGAFGDPFRAIEALPGVTPLLSGLPYFYIRGAPPNNNGYYVDGIRVPLLFHVGFGEGVIHPALLDHIDFYPGAAPASYGGVAGAIIAGATRDPAPTLHGEANVRLVDAGALLESPLGNDRGTVLVAGRYGYPGPIVGAISPDIQLGYWDYQTRATWKITERDALGVFALGSHDYLATKQADNYFKEQLVSDFHRVDLRYDHGHPGGHVRVAATFGYDSQGAAPSYLTDTSGAIRLETEQPLMPTLRLRAGADARVDAYGFRQLATPPNRSVAPSSADPPPTNVTASARADVVWHLTPRVELVPGARFDVFSSRRADAPGGTTKVTSTVPAVGPRLSARVALTDDVASLTALGLSQQFPALSVGDVPAIAVTGSGFPPGSEQLQTAAQASQGIEVTLPEDIVASATGFLSHWSGLTDLTAGCLEIMPPTFGPPSPGQPPAAPPEVCPGNQPMRGLAFGVEILVRTPLSKRLSGWLSYTLSRSVRTEHFPTLESDFVVATVASESDRTHVLNAVFAYDLGRGWRAGTRFVFYTGAPYSLLSGSVPIPPYNDHRGPAFFRLDLRLEKRWALGANRSIAFVFEIQNATLSKEFANLGLDCKGIGTGAGGTTQCTQPTIGPLTIPSVGVEAFF